MDYLPRPIETSEVVLSPELIDLTEKLAENAHEVWGLQRVKDGWTLGSKRDDSKKEHPCLVPYDQLPEPEKVYDRNTSMETLKAILALGFRILPPPAQVDREPSESVDASEFPLDALARGSSTPTPLSAEGCLVLAKRKLASGEPLLAYDIIETGLISDPRNVALRQQQALALARSGDPERAGRILQGLVESGNQDEETLGLLARSVKDKGLGLLDRDPGRARLELRRSYEIYLAAYRETGGLWTGVNAATLAVVLGDNATARLLAAQMHSKSLEKLQSQGSEDNGVQWTIATLGETALILGDFEEAERWYSRLSALCWSNRDYGDLASSRRQAKLLARYLSGAEGVVARCFRAPRVVVFSGHRIDEPGRALSRFPIELEEPVRLAIRERLEVVGAMIGYGSAATGADLLFLEELLARGGEAHVILPYEREQFFHESLSALSDTRWLERFQIVLAQSEVITASPQRIESGGLSYEFANLIAQGLGSLKARQLDADLLPMAVWDGYPGDGKGGTADTIRRWRNQGFEVDVIDLAAIARGNGFEPSRTAEQKEATDDDNLDTTGSRIAPILFADVVGFSKLTEQEIPPFVMNFLGLIASTLKRLPDGSVKKKNTWGDGLYCVFENVELAGRFALDLRDAVVESIWERQGLPHGMNIRIALHAGPVYVCTDPVTERLNYLGTHVSHAARIEPITPPGQVYASQAFAALAAASQVTEFDCHYVGQTPLAKGHGTFPTYHVHRSSR